MASTVDVMENEDLVSLIVSKGLRKRELARFQIVSRTWLKCCKKAMECLDHIVGLDSSGQHIHMINLTTHEVSPLELPRSLTLDLSEDLTEYSISLFDSCEGLVLIYVRWSLSEYRPDCGRVAVGNPCINQWKLLPNVKWKVLHGTISREEDTLVITLQDYQGGLFEYNVEKDTWDCVVHVMPRTRYSWWEGNYYSWFLASPCILDELYAEWPPVQQNFRLTGGLRWFPVQSNGRLFMYVTTLSGVRAFEVVNKSVIEMPSTVNVARIQWIVGSEDKLFWMESDGHTVVCHSKLDNSSESIHVNALFQSAVHYTDDGGGVFNRFVHRELKSKRLWTIKRAAIRFLKFVGFICRPRCWLCSAEGLRFYWALELYVPTNPGF